MNNSKDLSHKLTRNDVYKSSPANMNGDIKLPEFIENSPFNELYSATIFQSRYPALSMPLHRKINEKEGWVTRVPFLYLTFDEKEKRWNPDLTSVDITVGSLDNLYAFEKAFNSEMRPKFETVGTDPDYNIIKFVTEDEDFWWRAETPLPYLKHDLEATKRIEENAGNIFHPHNDRLRPEEEKLFREKAIRALTAEFGEYFRGSTSEAKELFKQIVNY